MKEFKQHVLEKIDKTLLTVGDNFPHFTENGSWVITEFGDWTGGFWVGQLLWAYHYTGKKKYFNSAEKCMIKLESRLDSRTMNFDLGFVFKTSFVDAYQLTGDEKYCEVAIRAAEKLLTFYHSKSHLLYTIYPERADKLDKTVGSSIVDVMMNLGLLWWAGVQTGEEKFIETAIRHANQTAELFVRSDGSTYHVVDFDLASGIIVNRGTIHGLNDESTWARGHAWAINGFIQAYNATGERSFIETVNSLVEYLFSSSFKDNYFIWDLDMPLDVNTTYDSSSAVIVADGFLHIKENKGFYDSGKAIISYLLKNFIANDQNHGILPNCTAYYNDGVGIHEATVWGDYYLLSSIRHLENKLEPEIFITKESQLA